MSVVIYVNGGHSIGYGHLMRARALAKAWLDRGRSVEYVTRTPDTVRDAAPNGARVSSIAALSELVPWTREADTDVVVTDSYEIDHSIQRELSDVTPFLSVISDQDRHPVCCDVLVNGNLYAPSLTYQWSGAEPTWCLGPAYVILRERIRELAADTPPLRETPEQALVTMGGGDQEKLTPTIIRAFDGFNIRVDAIVGPGFSTQQERDVRRAASDVAADVTVLRNPDDLPERMFRADFAVATASSTIYELLALGTPAVTVPIAENQEVIADELATRGLVTVLEPNPTVGTFRRGIERYITDKNLRTTRRELGRTQIDGNGVPRILDRIGEVTDV